MGLLSAIWLRGGTDASVWSMMESWSAGIQGWFVDHNSDIPTAPEATLRVKTSAVAPELGNHQYASRYSPLDHGRDDKVACGRPRTKPRSDVNSSLVYQWTDETGQTHMSDKRPQGRVASVMDIGPTKRDFTYKIFTDGISLPAGFDGKLNAGSKRIYDTWHFFLGDAKLRQSRIRLLLMGPPARFDAYRERISPGRKPVNGFYRMSNNQAVVKFDKNNLDRVLGTTFHEVSHLITASHLGPTPPWLTEGLAEYFENMQVQWQGGLISPNTAHIKLLKNTAIPRLDTFLSMDRSEWYGNDRSRNYAIAWSLMHFLMGGAPGMYAIQEVVSMAEENFCKPFSHVDALDQAYPGGIRRLEADWRKWLAVGEYRAQQV